MTELKKERTRRERVSRIALAVVILTGCSTRSELENKRWVTELDAASSTVRKDASIAFDSALRTDAVPRTDAYIPSDAGPWLEDAIVIEPDAFFDATVTAEDAGSSDGALRSDANSAIVFESSLLGTYDMTGSALSANFWPGWRFEVTHAVHITEVGFNGSMDDHASIFVAIVALTGPNDTPDSPDLRSTDVLANEVRSPGTSSAPRDIDLTYDVVLQPGWYALVVGTGAHGATSNGGNVTSGHIPVARAQGSFTIRQTDGAFILQSGARRFYLRGLSL